MFVAKPIINVILFSIHKVIRCPQKDANVQT